VGFGAFTWHVRTVRSHNYLVLANRSFPPQTECFCAYLKPPISCSYPPGRRMADCATYVFSSAFSVFASTLPFPAGEGKTDIDLSSRASLFPGGIRHRVKQRRRSRSCPFLVPIAGALLWFAAGRPSLSVHPMLFVPFEGWPIGPLRITGPFFEAIGTHPNLWWLEPCQSWPEWRSGLSLLMVVSCSV